MGADGVHIGQTDMPVPVARALLPPGSIIGKTCNTPEHVRIAVQEGADYVGIGPVWGTLTKKVKSPVVGPKGIGEMLQVLDGTDVKAVAIGECNDVHLSKPRYLHAPDRFTPQLGSTPQMSCTVCGVPCRRQAISSTAWPS